MPIFNFLFILIIIIKHQFTITNGFLIIKHKQPAAIQQENNDNNYDTGHGNIYQVISALFQQNELASLKHEHKNQLVRYILSNYEQKKADYFRNIQKEIELKQSKQKEKEKKLIVLNSKKNKYFGFFFKLFT